MSLCHVRGEFLLQNEFLQALRLKSIYHHRHGNEYLQTPELKRHLLTDLAQNERHYLLSESDSQIRLSKCALLVGQLLLQRWIE